MKHEAGQKALEQLRSSVEAELAKHEKENQQLREVLASQQTIIQAHDHKIRRNVEQLDGRARSLTDDILALQKSLYQTEDRGTKVAGKKIIEIEIQLSQLQKELKRVEELKMQTRLQLLEPKRAKASKKDRSTSITPASEPEGAPKSATRSPADARASELPNSSGQGEPTGEEAALRKESGPRSRAELEGDEQHEKGGLQRQEVPGGEELPDQEWAALQEERKKGRTAEQQEQEAASDYDSEIEDFGKLFENNLDKGGRFGIATSRSARSIAASAERKAQEAAAEAKAAELETKVEAQGQLLEDQRTRIEWLEKDVSKLQGRLSEANRLNSDKLKEI